MASLNIPVELRIRQLNLRIKLLDALCRSEGGKTERAKQACKRAGELIRERNQLQSEQAIGKRVNQKEEAA